MKAIRLHEIGGPQNLRFEDVETPTPQAGEVVVSILAAALNHREVFITQGLYPKIVVPRILGADGAGELDGKRVLINPQLDWGDDERIWRSDATILGMPRDGTFAQYVSVPHENVHEVPAHLSIEQAAALPLAGLTAYRALFTRGELRSGETLVITGVGGGVQTFVLLFAVAAGARVFVTSGSDEKLRHAQQLGAEGGVNYRTDPEWHKTVRNLAGTVDIAVDAAGGDTFARLLQAVRPGGRVVTYGRTSGDATIKMFPVFWNQLDIRGSSMGSPRDFREMLSFVEKHRIEPVIDRVYPLAEAAAAAERMNEAGQFGKIVLKV